MLQARVVRLEDLVPNSLRNERIGEPREAAFHTGQFSKCVTEVERLAVGHVMRDLGYVVIRLCSRIGGSDVVVKHTALSRQRKQIHEVLTDS